MMNKDQDILQIIWVTDDVLSQRPDLTKDQAREVLRAMERNHDANIGVNWDVIDVTASILFPKPSTPTKYEVQHRTMAGGWENTWTVEEKDQQATPQVFDSEAEAQAELDAFFRDVAEEIAYGERDEDSGYERADFRIVPLKS